MKRPLVFIVIVLICTFASVHTAFGLQGQTTDVLSEIERLASPSVETDRPLGESVADGIEKSPSEVSSAILVKLKDKKLTEKQLAVYVWALGLANDQAVVNVIKELHQQSPSDLVRGNCLRALATIGGTSAGEHLMFTLDATKDKEKRFDILNLLGQMQYEPAVQRAEELLKQDPKELYWQAIFFFGKMGDKAVPFLLKRVGNKDRNIRVNAINVLGQWLISPEAAIPLEDQFWAEKDAELRGMILGSLERIIADAALLKAVFEKVVAQENEGKLLQYARETLGSGQQMADHVSAFAQKKKPSAASFQVEYTACFKSAGIKGDYEMLGAYSTVRDEPRLKALRERILQRNSDEAFYDYQKINEIIILNRMINQSMSQKTSQPKP